MADKQSSIAAHQGRMDTNMIQVGIVKDNRDPKKMGRLKVWIQGSSAAEGSKTGWITCSYASPFAGNTKGIPNAKGFKDYPKSYGFWAVPPDVGTRVFVFFVNGKQEQAFWFGCAYDFGMNGMVPAPAADMVFGSGHNGPIPVVEYDRNSPNSDANAKYVNSTLLDGLVKQNLVHDQTVGSVNRSSRRQAPSQVYGMSTPRGNHVVLDDGYLDNELNAKFWDDDGDNHQNTEFGNPANDTTVGARKCEGIIFRTRSGAQIFISESDGFIFMINRDGTARFSMTAEGDIEMLADRDIKMRAKRNIEMRAEGNMKMEVFKNYNELIQGTTSTEHVGQHEFTCHADSMSAIDGTKRIYAKGSLQLQGDNSVHMFSPAAVNVKADSSLNLTGSSLINMTGGRGNATLNGDLNVALAVSAGGDVTSASASLNSHIHENIQGGKDKTPPPAGGTGKNPDARQAEPATNANAVTTTRHTQKQVDDVASVAVGGKVDKQVQKDIGVSSSKSLSSMSAVMPATGVIDKYGYWGKGVPQANGKKADNPGWLIIGSGNISAMYGGYVINRTANTVQIDHGNGFQSLYKGIKVSDSIQDGSNISTGQTIGTFPSTGKFLFEIRGVGAPLYGFTGTIDPGRFFIEETGVESASANKSLTLKKKTNSTAEVVETTDGETALMSKSSVSTICDSIVLSGSLRVPGNRAVSEVQYREAREKSLYVELAPSKQYLAPKGWVVKASDMKLRKDIVEHEGSIAAQSNVHYYKNGKFFVYQDRTNKSIGYGHNFTDGSSASKEFANGITEARALDLLAGDTQTAIDGAIKIYNKYDLRIPYEPQRVLTEMVFQMGYGKVLEFKKFLKALQNGDYASAINELYHSALYGQTPKRVDDYAAQLRLYIR